MLEAGNVLVFNTHVWHAGGVNEVDSAAMFLYYDKAHATAKGRGHNHMKHGLSKVGTKNMQLLITKVINKSLLMHPHLMYYLCTFGD